MTHALPWPSPRPCGGPVRDRQLLGKSFRQRVPCGSCSSGQHRWRLMEPARWSGVTLLLHLGGIRTCTGQRQALGPAFAVDLCMRTRPGSVTRCPIPASLVEGVGKGGECRDNRYTQGNTDPATRAGRTIYRNQGSLSRECSARSHEWGPQPRTDHKGGQQNMS